MASIQFLVDRCLNYKKKKNTLTIGATNWYARRKAQKQGQKLNGHEGRHAPPSWWSLLSKLEAFGESSARLPWRLWLDGTGSPALQARHLPSLWLTFKNIKDYRALFSIRLGLDSCCGAWTYLQTWHPYAIWVLFAVLKRDFMNRCWCFSENVGREGREDPADSGYPRGRLCCLSPLDQDSGPCGP